MKILSHWNVCESVLMRKWKFLEFGSLFQKMSESQSFKVRCCTPFNKINHNWAHRSNKGLPAQNRVEVLSTFQIEAKICFFKKTLNKNTVMLNSIKSIFFVILIFFADNLFIHCKINNRFFHTFENQCRLELKLLKLN